MGASAETSRRALLVAAAGGVAALVAQALGRAVPARAANGDAVTVGGSFSATSSTTFTNTANNNIVLVAQSATSTGIAGTSSSGIGVRGISDSWIGVAGSSSATDQPGIFGHSAGNSTGLFGFSTPTGDVARPATKAKTGVYGEATQDSASRGVWGRANAGRGVLGEATTGIAGFFTGGRAQLMLEPKATAGKPTSGSHAKGEIYMDSKSNVFICSVAGTPGTWKKVLTKLV